jgi:plasmid stabilization system protein ParE
MHIRWTPAAADDLQHIFDYLRETNPSIARSTIMEIREGIRSLKNFPHRGRPGSGIPSFNKRRATTDRPAYN